LIDSRLGLTLVPSLELNDVDLDRLVRQLETHRRLGVLKRFQPHSSRIARLRELSDRDLMAAMVEVITGHRFEDRVIAEFDQLSDIAQDVYEAVCLFEAIQFEDRTLTLSKNAVIQIVSEDRLNRALSQVLNDLVGKRLLVIQVGADNVRSRHRRVAEEVFQRVRQDQTRFPRLFEAMLHFYAVRAANIRNRNDPTRRIMIRFLNHRVMVDTGMDADVVRSIYSRLHRWLKNDFHYWLQCAEYELEKNGPATAASYLESARGCEGGAADTKVITSWGRVRLLRAAADPLDARLHADAIEAVDELEQVALRAGVASPHTFVALAREATNWLDATSLTSGAERVRIAIRLQHVIQVGIRLIRRNREFEVVAARAADRLAAIIEGPSESLIPL
jgi:hypothetical protein